MKRFARLHPATGELTHHEIGYVATLTYGQPDTIQIERRMGTEWQIPAAAISPKVYATVRGALYAAIRYRAAKRSA